MMKRWSYFLLIGAGLLAACQSNQKEPAAADSLTAEVDTGFTGSEPGEMVDAQKPAEKAVSAEVNPNRILVTCEAVGDISLSDTYDDLLRKAGKSQLSQDSVWVKGKFYGVFATTVWKGTPGEISVHWQEDRPPYRRIQRIVISRPGATYVLQNGIKLGSRLSTVARLNGKPFSLWGSGNDRGLLASYDGGDLEAQIGCVRPVFDLQDKENGSAGKTVSSADVLRKAGDPVIVKLIINAR